MLHCILAVFFHVSNKTMNKLQLIHNKIYEIRGQRVMLDYDLAEMYGVDTAQLKRAVRRNIERFEGEDFMFELTKEEHLRCQFGISSHGGIRYMPFAFTELGVAMLSSVHTTSIQPLRFAFSRNMAPIRFTDSRRGA